MVDGRARALFVWVVLLSVGPIAHGQSDLLDVAIEEAICGMDFDVVSDSLSICGDVRVDAERMTAFVRRHNPKFDQAIAEACIEVGRRYGLRGDVAFCQAIVETGWFRFGGGTAVKPDDHNYCGLGVVRTGRRGVRFATVDEGVTAHLQHLYAYAVPCGGKMPDLPEGERLVDPRFGAVARGSASSWHDLSGRWAQNKRYGERILKIYSDLLVFTGE